MTQLLLLSGGLDSTCLAAWLRPDHCLSVDYGQRPAQAEQHAAAAVAGQLDIPVTHIKVDASAVGCGLMAGDNFQPDATSAAVPTPEWWPYRNQLLITQPRGESAEASMKCSSAPSQAMVSATRTGPRPSTTPRRLCYGSRKVASQ